MKRKAYRFDKLNPRRWDLCLGGSNNISQRRGGVKLYFIARCEKAGVISPRLALFDAPDARPTLNRSNRNLNAAFGGMPVNVSLCADGWVLEEDAIAHLKLGYPRPIIFRQGDTLFYFNH